jgi:protein-S-isoprenylcysteine O-methyltransferase Ste14
MVKFGDKLFHYRNYIFPLFYLFLFLPSRPLFNISTLTIIVGFIVAISGQALRIATIGLVYIIRGGKNRRIYAEGLVTEGLFAHCRNPLYVGNILIIAGLGIISGSMLFNLVLTPLFIFFYHAIVSAEENFLRNKFGDDYIRYTSDVNRWLPDFKGLSSTVSSMNFNWQRVFIREYTSIFIWLSGALLLIMKYVYVEKGSVEFEKLKIIFAISGILLLSFYLFVRYMKKSHRWTANEIISGSTQHGA